MPDISMCRNMECKLRMNCYRYRAKPNSFRQSYGTFYLVGDKCNYFWDLGLASTELETIENLEIMEAQSKQDPDKQN